MLSQLNVSSNIFNEGATAASVSPLSLKINLLRELTTVLAEQVQSLNVPQPINIQGGINLHDEVRRFEIEMIKSALLFTNGHQRAAARLLGLKPTTLNAKLKLYKITFKHFDYSSDTNTNQDASDVKELTTFG
jgi:DNA-binding NtrC family response regulator